MFAVTQDIYGPDLTDVRSTDSLDIPRADAYGIAALFTLPLFLVPLFTVLELTERSKETKKELLRHVYNIEHIKSR